MTILQDQPIHDNETVFDLVGDTHDLLEDHGTYPRSSLLASALIDHEDGQVRWFDPFAEYYDQHVIAWHNHLEEDYYQFMKETLSSLPHDKDCCCTLCV